MTRTSMLIPHVGDDDTSGTYTPENVFTRVDDGFAEVWDMFPDGPEPVAWTPRLVTGDANGFTNTTASSVSIATNGTCTKSGHTFVDGMKVEISSLSAGSLTGLANGDQFYITQVGASTFKFQDGRGNPVTKSFGGSGNATATVSTVGHAWTPSGGSGGMNPLLGAGVATGLKWRMGKWCVADFTIPFGAGATAGVSAYRVSLPHPARADRSWVEQTVGDGHIVGGTGFIALLPGSHFNVQFHLAPSVTSDVCGIVIGSLTDDEADYVLATAVADNVAAGVPWAWADTMSIRGRFGYWIA